MAIVTILIALALAATGAQWIYRLWFSPVSRIPGPLLARVSILWQLWHVWKGDYQDVIQEVHRKYGMYYPRQGPLVRVNSDEVSVCNDEAVTKILNQPLDKGSWYRIFAMPDSTFKNQMSELSAKKFAVVQRKIARGYATSSLIKMEDDFDRAVRLFMEGVAKDASRDTERAVSLNDWFTFYSFDIVGLATFSREFGFLATGTDVGGCVATSNSLTIYLAVMAYFPDVHDWLTAMLSPILLFFGLQPMKHVMKTTEQALRSRETDDTARDDMVSYWKRQKEDDPLSPRDLFSTANANVAAGGDTVGTAEQAFVYYVLKTPGCRDRLQAELDQAMSEGKICVPVTYQATLQLPYFQACLKETLRRHPVSPTGFVRIAPAEGIELSGTYFPAGTVVSVNPWALHHDEALFGPDATVFRPERWLEPGAAEFERYHIPFGSGYMTCPGRNLGMIEMSKLLVTMFLQWNIELEKPAEPWKIRSTILVKGKDWRIKIRPRKTA